MDPASAFALSCNCLQVIGLGIKVAQGCRELRKGGGDYAVLGEQTNQFRTSNEILQSSLRAGSSQDLLSEAERPLFEISQRCLDTASALYHEVQKEKIPEQSGRKRKIFKNAFKSSAGFSKVPQLEKELSRQRDALNTQILVDLRSREVLNDEELKHLEQLNENNMSLLKKISRKQDEILKGTDKEGRSIREHVTKEISKLSLKESAEQHENTHENLLRSIKFGDIFTRYEEVHDRHDKTFEWIFSPAEGSSDKKNNFREWLEHGDGFYWFNGKAGSGKSTLMLFVHEDKQRRTQQYLQVWGKGK